jgi:DnaJ-domain-containing protein 1
MTALLEKALQQLEAQPPDTQDAIASQIIEALEDEAWERSFAQNPEKLSKLIEQAKDEIAQGKTRPLDELL